MTTISIALWAVDIGHPLASMGEWLDALDARMAAARRSGADLLVLPEYASAQWLTWRPADLPAAHEIAFLADTGLALEAPLAGLVRRHGLGLLAGTLPVRNPAGGPPFNRALLLLPEADGEVRVLSQDKLRLTPGERDPESWTLAAGDTLRIISWRGLRLAITICLDVEQPALAAALAGAGIDLLLVPSMTAKPSGYHRVFDCAKARAIEMMTIVCVVGTIGTVAGQTSHSGAAVFVPCEEVLGSTGVWARLAPRAVAAPEDPPGGPMLIARDLPVERVRAMRAGEAEVWPGPWEAAGIRILAD